MPDHPSPIAHLLDAHADDPNERIRCENARPEHWRNPEPLPRYDLVILGAGAAGLACAHRACAIGARVAIVERRRLGGGFLHDACVPSKTLVRASRAIADLARASDLGVRPAGGASVDFPALMSRLRAVRATITASAGIARLVEAGVHVFFGDGAFIDEATVQVADKHLRFKRSVIATGSRPAAPQNIPGLGSIGYLTNETIFDLKALPRRLVVIGGGPLGCELAQVFRRFDSVVTIVQRRPLFLPKEERDAAQILGQAFAREGINLRLNSAVTAVERDADGIQVHIKTDDISETVSADVILTGVGRWPIVDGLGLDAAKVAWNEDSGILVDDFLRTSNPRIYSAGDACMKEKFTPAAEVTAELAVHNALCHGRRRRSALNIPWCTFTDPEIAHVGMYVQDAQSLGIDVDTITIPMHEVHRAVIDGTDEGFLKVHLAGGTDRILGATMVGRHAAEVINEFTVAIEAGVGLGFLGGIIHVYPTYASAIAQAADAYRRTRPISLVQRFAARYLLRRGR